MALSQSTRRARRPWRAGTKEHLVAAAERLFAEHGVDSVSIRQITSAAGARNESALQYHFGSKEELVEAIFELRMAPINERRLQLLSEIAGDTPEKLLRNMVRAMVMPLAENLLRSAGRTYYCRFLARLQSDPRQVSDLIHRRHYSSVHEWMAHYRRLKPDLPLHIAKLRVRSALTALAHGAADYERELSSQYGHLPLDESRERVGNLVDCLVGILATPVVDAADDMLPDPAESPPPTGEGAPAPGEPAPSPPDGAARRSRAKRKRPG